jgi:RHS repeat-associated protein
VPRRHITYQRITNNGAERSGWANALVNPLQDHLPVDQQGLNQLLVERFEILEDCSGQQADFVYLQDRFESILDQLTANDPENVQYFYHSDHLGSSSFITDASGTVDQHLQYLPFGEPWIDQRTTTGIRFTFSGKELDSETNYSYFGARYYNADISIWLSVDPLSDQAPGWTPYRYGFNNPIRFVDPNGMFEDEWELDSKGNVINRIENKNYDSFHIVEKDEDGNYQRVASSKELEYGTVTERIGHKAGDEKLTLFEIKGDEIATHVFQFLADNYTVENGRPNEWTHARVGFENSGRNIIGTSHSAKSTSVGHYLRINQYTLKEVNHNHPTNNPRPSWDQSNGPSNSKRGDVPMAKLYETSSPNVRLNIYTCKYGLSPYDSHGTLDTRILNGLIP